MAKFYPFQQNNVSVVNPTVNDDRTKGYEIGSTWINTMTVKLWRCFDDAPRSALWKEITLA